MSAILISGKDLALTLEQVQSQRASALRDKLGRALSVSFILVGEDSASQIYIRKKSEAAGRIGIDVIDLHLPSSISQRELNQRLIDLSADGKVDGVLLQLPLPGKLDAAEALSHLSPDKDIDGLSVANSGRLLTGEWGLRPCTPSAVLALARESRRRLGLQDKVMGSRAIVIGRSVLVGKPTALMLLGDDYTVTVAHSRTPDLAALCRESELIVAAVGSARIIKGNWIRPGAVVVDVGINRLTDGRIVGDVEFEVAKEVAGAITPVPGGVGPMTISMLMENLLEAAARRSGVC